MRTERATMWRRAAGVAGAMVAVDSARRARRRSVGPTEARVFRSFNERSDRMVVPVWVVMQAGSLGAVVLAASVVAHRRGRRSAGLVGVAGTGVWVTAKLLKPLVGRGRPEHYLDGVIVRGARQSGLGYPSGHAAVAVTLALTVPGAFGRPRLAHGLAASAGAVVVGAARMYVGAHLPLDVVGGYALGTGVGVIGSALLR